jgi:hypothetical protein
MTSIKNLEDIEEALDQAAELLMLANQHRYGPLMQVVRLRIAGVEYECFTSVVAHPDDDVPMVQAIEFGQILPMKTVIQWMTTAQESFNKGRDAGMQ